MTKQSKDKISCPKCNTERVKKRGFRRTANRKKIQRYECKDCKHAFVQDHGFFKMKNHENKITACLDMYYSGMSLRKIQSHLQMFAPHNCHYSTIYRWLVKYATMISGLTDNIKTDGGQELMSDEMEYKRLGNINWFVDVLDTKTRFIVASDFMKSRTIDNLTKVLKQGKQNTGDRIKIVTTDCLAGYDKVLHKSFGLQSPHQATSRAKSKIIHNKVKADERGFNYKIERLHGTIRERTKVMRGFHGSLYSAKMIMKGMEIYYNYVRKHQGIDNKTPQQEAIPFLDLGVNKWLNLIKLSKI